MHDEILAPATRLALTRLSDWTSKRRFYLAGGTGCALHLGHRMSHDLDFFVPAQVEPTAIQKSLAMMGRAVVDYSEAGTWVGSFDGVKAGFFSYPVELVGPLVSFQGTSVASLEDIGCMKIEAIAGRGKKRDFVDLVFILKSVGIELRSLLDLHRKKYGPDRLNMIHVLKSLVYFIDAEGDPEPAMLAPYSWAKTKTFLRAEIRGVGI